MANRRTIEHLVLFKWRVDVPVDQIAKIEAGLRALKDKVPGIVDLTCGRNFSPRGKGFNTGLYVRFAQRQDLDGYATHPEHVRVVDELVKPSLDEIIVSDFEA